MKNIKKILEDNNFVVTKEGNQYFISQYTPAGEDWGFYLDKLEDLKTLTLTKNLKCGLKQK